MDYEQIIAEQAKEIISLKHELAMLKKLIFGSKREKFVAQDDTQQLSLFDVDMENVILVEEQKERITYERKVAKKHEGRNEIPEHLPVQEVVIEPEEDTTGLVKIGEEITSTLEYTPASLVKKVTKRPKYAKAQGEGIIIAPLPSRPIDKGIAEASLLSHIIVSKFIDHLPFYRQIQRFKRDYNWEVNSSTINDWFIACCTLLHPLHEHLKKRVFESGYIQADESPIRVLDQDKEGSSHQGYMWAYHAPKSGLVYFQYRKGRGENGPKELLQHYTGALQCDGYAVYDKIGKSYPFIKLAGCLAHVRRKFYEARENDKARSEKALTIIQSIYGHEKVCKSYSPEERKLYRQENVAPIFEELKTWIEEQSVIVLPQSTIGKAMNYTQKQWHKLINILSDGQIEMDNNLIENKIRPLALGRKNYLFAGSHEGAQRIAMIYSFFGTCSIHGINPYQWLKETLENIKDTKLSQLETLLPIHM